MTAYVPIIDKFIVGFDTDSSAFEFYVVYKQITT